MTYRQRPFDPQLVANDEARAFARGCPQHRPTTPSPWTQYPVFLDPPSRHLARSAEISNDSVACRGFLQSPFGLRRNDGWVNFGLPHLRPTHWSSRPKWRDLAVDSRKQRFLQSPFGLRRNDGWVNFGLPHLRPTHWSSRPKWRDLAFDSRKQRFLQSPYGLRRNDSRLVLGSVEMMDGLISGLVSGFVAMTDGDAPNPSSRPA